MATSLRLRARIGPDLRAERRGRIQAHGHAERRNIHGLRRIDWIDCRSKLHDILVLGGSPAEKIENIEKVDIVFKNGVGYNRDRLIQSVSGLVGLL